MGNVVDTLFGGGQGAGYEALERQLREAQSGFRPYQQAGESALPEYQHAIQEMADPQAYYQKMMSGYEQSPQAQMQMQQGTQAANRGAAAAGLLGSGAHQKGLQQYGQQVTAADQQRWLQDMLGIRGGYTGGLQNLMQQGYRGAQDVGSLYGGIGQAQYGQNVARAAPWSQLMGSLMSGGMGGMGGMGGF